MHVLGDFFRDGLRRALNQPRVRRARFHGDPDVKDNVVQEGTEWHDAVAITCAVAVLGAVGLVIEHVWHIDGDIFYDVLSVCGAHPLSRGFKRILILFC